MQQTCALVEVEVEVELEVCACVCWVEAYHTVLEADGCSARARMRVLRKKKRGRVRGGRGRVCVVGGTMGLRKP